jgi:dihydrofolate reductase
MIRAILACDENYGIGKNGDLPWPHNPADLKWFKECTVGGVVAMGKRTWDSLPTKPLPNRNNVVITSSEMDRQGPYHFLTFDQAPSHLKSMAKLQDVWVIGGAQLVHGLYPIIEEFWLSRIQGTYDCDTFLPVDIIEGSYSLYSSQLEGDVYVDKWKRI